MHRPHAAAGGTVRLRGCNVRSGSVVIPEKSAEPDVDSRSHSDTIVPVVGCAVV
jgi:hypothetical protein